MTNQVYVAVGGSTSVVAIDGTTYATTTIAEPNGAYPRALAVNPVTNLIYAANTCGYHQGNVVSSGLNLWLENYLFGPRISCRRSKRWTPFAQFLAGGAHASGTLFGAPTGTGGVTSFSLGSANAFALSAGGGLDWNASRHVSVRLFQAEYLNTRLPNSGNDVQNNLRLTFGVVFHSGKK